MSELQVKIEPGWKEALADQFRMPYFQELKAFLIEEKRKYDIFPPGNQIFSAFNHTPISDVKVVIIGQDPYHGRVRLMDFVSPYLTELNLHLH